MGNTTGDEDWEFWWVIVVVYVVKLQMDFQDVAFLPSRASLYTTFLKNYGKG